MISAIAVPSFMPISPLNGRCQARPGVVGTGIHRSVKRAHRLFREALICIAAICSLVSRLSGRSQGNQDIIGPRLVDVPAPEPLQAATGVAGFGSLTIDPTHESARKHELRASYSGKIGPRP